LRNNLRFPKITIAVLLAGLGFFIGATIATPAFAQKQGAARTDVVELRAVVESIDQSTRTVLLRNEDGNLASVTVGPEVRNLPQVKAGDAVVLLYGETLIAQIVGPTAGNVQPTAETMVGRTKQGAMPGAVRQDTVTMRVKVTAIDLPNNLVTFTGPGGASHTAPVRRPQMQRLLRSVKVGDDVDLTFTRAVAIRVIRG
jgi:hypothetical protein